jgi:hypothetical protein
LSLVVAGSIIDKILVLLPEEALPFLTAPALTAGSTTDDTDEMLAFLKDEILSLLTELDDPPRSTVEEMLSLLIDEELPLLDASPIDAGSTMEETLPLLTDKELFLLTPSPPDATSTMEDILPLLVEAILPLLDGVEVWRGEYTRFQTINVTM